MTSVKTNVLPAINFHLWRPCNFKCKFCFATFDDTKEMYRKKGHLSQQEMLQIIDEIADYGISKITFAGGEPLLCKWLPDLIIHAKKRGLTTMIVTNGWLLSQDWLFALRGKLDWVTLSIDSLTTDHQLAIGRSNKNTALSQTDYQHRIDWIRDNGMKFKMNTVVCSINQTENISDFVTENQPKRWKIFQVLPIVGQNDFHIADMLITSEQFQNYIDRHQHVTTHDIELVVEDNDLMTGSYLMIDPLGRLYDNINGSYRYSQTINEIGFTNAFQQITVLKDKFYQRGGRYDWS